MRTIDPLDCKSTMIPATDTKESKAVISPKVTRARSNSVASAQCTPHASFTEQWVCDCCGSTKFDYEVQEGWQRCEHEERSLHFVGSM